MRQKKKKNQWQTTAPHLTQSILLFPYFSATRVRRRRWTRRRPLSNDHAHLRNNNNNNDNDDDDDDDDAGDACARCHTVKQLPLDPIANIRPRGTLTTTMDARAFSLWSHKYERNENVNEN